MDLELKALNVRGYVGINSTIDNTIPKVGTVNSFEVVDVDPV